MLGITILQLESKILGLRLSEQHSEKLNNFYFCTKQVKVHGLTFTYFHMYSVQ